MNEPLSIIRLIVQASIPVQIVIAILLLASLTSWAIIFRKRRIIGRARREADRFEGRFWSGDDLATLYRAIESHGVAGLRVTRLQIYRDTPPTRLAKPRY